MIVVVIIPHQDHAFTSRWLGLAEVTLVLTWTFGKLPVGDCVLVGSSLRPQGFQPAVSSYSLMSAGHSDCLWAVNGREGTANPSTLNRARHLFIYWLAICLT